MATRTIVSPLAEGGQRQDGQPQHEARQIPGQPAEVFHFHVFHVLCFHFRVLFGVMSLFAPTVVFLYSNATFRIVLSQKAFGWRFVSHGVLRKSLRRNGTTSCFFCSNGAFGSRENLPLAVHRRIGIRIHKLASYREAEFLNHSRQLFLEGAAAGLDLLWQPPPGEVPHAFVSVCFQCYGAPHRTQNSRAYWKGTWGRHFFGGGIGLGERRNTSGSGRRQDRPMHYLGARINHPAWRCRTFISAAQASSTWP